MSIIWVSYLLPFPLHLFLKSINYFTRSARVREAEIQTNIWKNCGSDNPNKKARAFLKMQQTLIAAQELGDEKMQILQSIQDKIEVKTRLLEQDFKNLGEFTVIFFKNH